MFAIKPVEVVHDLLRIRIDGPDEDWPDPAHCSAPSRELPTLPRRRSGLSHSALPALSESGSFSDRFRVLFYKRPPTAGILASSRGMRIARTASSIRSMSNTPFFQAFSNFLPDALRQGHSSRKRTRPRGPDRYSGSGQRFFPESPDAYACSLPGVFRRVEIMQTVQSLLNFREIIFLTGFDLEIIPQRLVRKRLSAFKPDGSDFKFLRSCPGPAGGWMICPKADCD